MYKQEFNDLLEKCAVKYSIKGKPSPSYSSFENYNYQSSILRSLGNHPEKEKIQEEVIQFLKDSGNYEKVSITGPGYISVKVKVKDFNEEMPKEKKKIVIDYCGANVAKKMHIGHIRSMFIGDYISRLHENKGNEVYRFNHIGDWGNQFGFLIEYILSNKIIVKNNQQLTEIYKKASALNEENPEFKKMSEARAFALQQKDPETVKCWSRCCSISLYEMNDIFTQFGLEMTADDSRGESFYAKFCPQVEKMLINAGVAVVGDDGSVFIPDEDPKKSPLVIKKSTGSYLYAMYDLVAIHYRVNNINPDEIIYVVDKRQELHFKQVFAVAKKMGWDSNCKLNHIGFGTILGVDKRPLKTRSGENLYLEDLLEQGFEEMKEHPAIAKLEIADYKEEVLNKTLFGALKFYDLHFVTHIDYVFAWEHVLNTKGNSAPYIQNAVARIDSIFLKIKGAGCSSDNLFNGNFDSTLKNIKHDEDMNKILDLYFKKQVTSEIMNEIKDKESHFLTEAAIELCKSFHLFYESVNISQLSGEKQQFALDVIASVSSKLKDVCNVMGIETYNCEKVAELKHKKKIKPC